MRFNPIATLAFLFISAGVVCAQQGTPRSGTGSFGDGRGTIRGAVVMPDGRPVNESLKITLKVLRGDATFSYTDQQGRFELPNLTPGQYTVEVEPDRNQKFEVTGERVQVPRGGGLTFVTLHLKEKRSDDKATTRDKTISVAMLDQKVPSAAKREFENASRMAAEGNSTAAIEGLRRAIAIYPDYLMARNDLGAQLLEVGELDAAASELRRAITIDPKAFNPQLNLGIVLLRQDAAAEALVVLDKALSLESSSPAAHLYAGLASMKLNDPARAEKELIAAFDLGSTTYAVALLHLGKLYMKKGDKESARKSFESYLRELPDAPDAAQIQKLIGTLR